MTDTVLSAFLQRVVPHTADAFQITLDTRTPDGYTVTFADGAVHIVAGSRISACNAVYDYLKQICRVNLSWSGLIKEFYAVRWTRFYDAAIDAAKQGKSLETEKGQKSVTVRAPMQPSSAKHCSNLKRIGAKPIQNIKNP